MKLIPFADFPQRERDALHAALVRLGIPAQHVCVSRLQPVPGVDDAALPTVVLVSAPGWSRSYEGADWVAGAEAELAAVQGAASRGGEAHSGPAPLGSY